MRIALMLTFLTMACSSSQSQARAQGVPADGQDRIGVAAPAFNLQHWINSPPVEIGELKGKVILVRWWTDTCDLCAATAPALRKLQEEYGNQGFQVIGIFHPKPAGERFPGTEGDSPL